MEPSNCFLVWNGSGAALFQEKCRLITVEWEAEMMITRKKMEGSQPSENKVFKGKSRSLVDFVCLSASLFSPPFFPPSITLLDLDAAVMYVWSVPKHEAKHPPTSINYFNISLLVCIPPSISLVLFLWEKVSEQTLVSCLIFAVLKMHPIRGFSEANLFTVAC